jgi:hypothetical protein
MYPFKNPQFDSQITYDFILNQTLGMIHNNNLKITNRNCVSSDRFRRPIIIVILKKKNWNCFVTPPPLIILIIMLV